MTRQQILYCLERTTRTLEQAVVRGDLDAQRRMRRRLSELGQKLKAWDARARALDELEEESRRLEDDL